VRKNSRNHSNSLRHSYTTKQAFKTAFKTVSRPLPTTDDGKDSDIAAVL
jgi:hypothetical protein